MATTIDAATSPQRPPASALWLLRVGMGFSETVGRGGSSGDVGAVVDIVRVASEPASTPYVPREHLENATLEIYYRLIISYRLIHVPPSVSSSCLKHVPRAMISKGYKEGI